MDKVFSFSKWIVFRITQVTCRDHITIRELSNLFLVTLFYLHNNVEISQTFNFRTSSYIPSCFSHFTLFDIRAFYNTPPPPAYIKKTFSITPRPILFCNFFWCGALSQLQMSMVFSVGLFWKIYRMKVVFYGLINIIKPVNYNEKGCMNWTQPFLKLFWIFYRLLSFTNYQLINTRNHHQVQYSCR